MAHTRDEMEVEKNTQIVPELVHNVRGVKQVRCRDNALRGVGSGWRAR